tara:strand:- start:214 stop:519 length:306 start_codon:yes stop_codon:yes gene_type:complete
MAIKINTPITTDEGFTVDNAFGYLNIYILAPQSNWVNLNYYKSEQDWIDGKSPLNVSMLPNQVQTELTTQEFWGQVSMIIHNKCLVKIEEVIGEGNATIVQ